MELTSVIALQGNHLEIFAVRFCMAFDEDGFWSSAAVR